MPEFDDLKERMMMLQKHYLVLQKKEEKSDGTQRFNIILGTCLCFICFLFVNFIIGTIYWYQGDMEDRDRIDHRNITISEKLIDYTTNDVIKCTNNHPCYFTCSYVREHFEVFRNAAFG